MNVAVDFADLVAIALFIYGLHELNSPATARRGNRLAMGGMAIALVGIIVQTGGAGWPSVVIGIAIGGLVGIYAALKVKMTAMPQMVALYNGAGGGAAALISTVRYFTAGPTANIDAIVAVSLVLSAIIGAISFSGSIIAFLKLQEVMTGRPVTYPGQQIVNGIVLIAILGLAIWFVATLGVLPGWAFPLLLLAALLLGVFFTLPIGGADMPVVISLLNSFTGVAVAITGFVLTNSVLIISGTLVGASGTLLTMLMAKAMNRSLGNVLFGAFGAVSPSSAAAASSGPAASVRTASIEDVATMCAYARS